MIFLEWFFSIAGHSKKEVSLAEYENCNTNSDARNSLLEWFLGLKSLFFFCTSLGLQTPKDHFEFDNC
jgi:hypothetical protein